MKASGGEDGASMSMEGNGQASAIETQDSRTRSPHAAADQITQNADELHEHDDEHDHLGGGRFNRKLLVAAGAFAVLVGVVAAEGLQSAGVKRAAATAPQANDNGADAERHQAEVAELAAGGARAQAAPAAAAALPAMVMTIPHQQAQAQVEHGPRTPSRYAQWAEDKYMRALEAPQMVGAFHSADTLAIARSGGEQGGNAGALAPEVGSPNVTLQPPASPYTVMTGSVIPAVLVSGIDSDLPGPILAQVSENVFDSATGQRLLIPQGSRLIGSYQSAMGYGQQRVAIAWQRLIFPDTSSMQLPQMPGTDQSGTNGFTDQVNNHYLATFATAAVTSLISAGQAVGQIAAFGGGGTYGPYGYYQPNQWATAGETAGSTASGQFGGVGQQMMEHGMNRPPTIEIRPGYEFNVMVTEDLVFPGPYKG
jgi:type IV secretory pathway VirB10-like protein